MDEIFEQSNEDKIASLEARVRRMTREMAELQNRPQPRLDTATWQNPIRNRVNPGNIDGSLLSITQEANFDVTADFTTTTVGSLVLVRTFNIYVPRSRQCLYAFYAGSVKHTIASATCRFVIGFDPGDGGGDYQVCSLSDIVIPVAGQPLPVHLSGGFDVDANFLGTYTPASRAVHLYVQNNTAGTLTIPCQSNMMPLHGFVTGDSSSS